ncbi:reverse transcriptase domain-containing protein [Tanacetum coccineum]
MILERTVGEHRARWADKLDDALWDFRTAFKTPIGCTPYKLVYGKDCHLPIELEHKAYWALKWANFDLKTAGDHRKVQLNELNELRDQAYQNSLIYKEKTKKIHDAKIKTENFISEIVLDPFVEIPSGESKIHIKVLSVLWGNRLLDQYGFRLAHTDDHNDVASLQKGRGNLPIRSKYDSWDLMVGLAFRLWVKMIENEAKKELNNDSDNDTDEPILDLTHEENPYDKGDASEDLENFGNERMELILDVVEDRLDDDWFTGTVTDEDDLDGIVDYLELESHDDFIDIKTRLIKKEGVIARHDL